MQFATFTPGPGYDPDAFYASYGEKGRIFDSAYFSERLGSILFSSFMKMSLIVGSLCSTFAAFLLSRPAALLLSPFCRWRSPWSVRWQR